MVGHWLDGVWSLPLWVSLLQYVPFYVLLLVGWRKGWGMFHRPTTLSTVSLSPPDLDQPAAPK